MKKASISSLAEGLLAEIYSSVSLKEVSMALEDLARNKHLKSHAAAIVTDPSLNPSQKHRQLNYLLSNIENVYIQDYLSDKVGAGEIWLFDNQKIDYLDEFVQAFQQATESIRTLHLTTAIQLTEVQIRTISRDLSLEFGCKIIINGEVNTSIIGGIQVKLDNYIFDFSLRTKFQQFQREWLASLEKTSKQTGRYDLDTASLEAEK